MPWYEEEREQGSRLDVKVRWMGLDLRISVYPVSIKNRNEVSRTLTAIEGFNSWSIAAASARRLAGQAGEAMPCPRFKLPSELGVRMPERGRDASPSKSPSFGAEEDIEAVGAHSMHNIVGGMYVGSV